MRIPTISELAKKVISDIENSQDSSTDQSRRDALDDIKRVVDSPSTDKHILKAFQDAIEKVKTQGKFNWLAGHRGSTFLRKAQAFVDSVTPQIVQEETKEEKKPLHAALPNPVKERNLANSDTIIAEAGDWHPLPNDLPDLILKYPHLANQEYDEFYASLSEREAIEEEIKTKGSLPNVLLDIVFEYAEQKVLKNKVTPFLRKHGSFAEKEKINTLCARNIAHVLLRHGNVHKDVQLSLMESSEIAAEEKLGGTSDEIAERIAKKTLEKSLAFLAQNPELHDEIIEVFDENGQRVRGNIFQILLMAGDRNPRALRDDEDDYGLVERVYRQMPSERQTIADQQLQALHSPEWKKATEKTMASYKGAIDSMIQTIIEAKIDPSANYKALLKEYTKIFAAALVPDPDHVATSGFLFDMSIFQYFFDQWNHHVGRLGGFYSFKDDLVGDIIHLSLQARVQRCDLELFNTGIGNVLSGRPDAPLPSSRSMPNNLLEFFKTRFFGFFGNKFAAWGCARGCRRCGDAFPTRGPFFTTYVKQKHQDFISARGCSHRLNAR